jgi:thymidylate kinase
MAKKNVNGVLMDLTPEEEAQRIAREEQSAIEKADYDAKEYQRNRKGEYPSIVDQLDEIYHSGIDAWKATIKATKDKYPKS